MAFTGKLGTVDSQLGSIVLGMGEPDGGLDQIVEQSLSFMQSAEGDVGDQIEDEASQSLSLSDMATAYRVFSRSAADTLSFTDEGTHNIFEVLVEQSISFSEVVDARGPIYMSVQHSLNLVQDEDDTKGINHQDVEQELDLSDVVRRQQTINVSQTLSLIDSGERKNIILHALSLIQSVLIGKGGNVSQTLTFADVASRQATLRRTLTQSLAIVQSVTFYVEGGCLEKSYRPFIGADGDPDFPPPTTVEPVLGRTNLTLTYPYVTPTMTVELRNPDFGNKDRLNFNRINRQTRGGTLIVFSDPKWPKSQTLSLQVSGLKAQQCDDLLQFIAASLGKEIGLLDYENRQWRGIIANPDSPITHVNRTDRSVTIEFQGELV